MHMEIILFLLFEYEIRTSSLPEETLTKLDLSNEIREMGEVYN